MNWFNEMIIDVQHRFFSKRRTHRANPQPAARKTRKIENTPHVDQFRARLEDLDRRLLSLR